MRAVEVDMGVTSARERRERENKSESKRRNNVRGDKAGVDVDVTMALRRLYAP